jgi:hypothetical protein
MESPIAVVWTGDGADRFVGKLSLSEDEVILDGTTTTPERRHDRVQLSRTHIHRATAERLDGATVIRIVAAEGMYLVEPVSGGRGSALSLANQLAR